MANLELSRASEANASVEINWRRILLKQYNEPNLIRSLRMPTRGL